MSKAKLIKNIKADIDKLWRDRKAAVESMLEQKLNPQVAGMIEKNKGYMMALEDINDLLS